ncbi:MAG: helix-turn-helix domain-containing protein, partial [Turicibacter bilis]
KICEVLDCQPGDLLVYKKFIKKMKNKMQNQSDK